MVKITAVAPRSRAARAGVLAGDSLISINGEAIEDVLDYRFYLAEKSVTLVCEREGERYAVTLQKDVYDDIGLDFETPLMDEKRRCQNACIFCFIDQLPRGLRETLYFKDDDSRLSFLHGNYITLTNLKDKDIDRIIKMRFSPVRVSVHTTNPALRVQMMKNKRAGEVLAYLSRIAEAGLDIHAQIVLCRGVKDGEELDRTLHDLARLCPALCSLSVVPAGLTDHRDGLYPLTPFTKEECRAIIRQVNSFGDRLEKQNGARTVYLADEFYLQAELPLPDAAYYEDYSQIENGVGMLRSLVDEAELALDDADGSKQKKKRTVSIATGVAAYETVGALARQAEEKYPHLSVRVYCIENRFFGQHITVAGLLTGKDIAEQLKDKELGECLLLPRTTLRSEGDLFLCGMSADELSSILHIPLVFVDNDGDSLISALLGR